MTMITGAVGCASTPSVPNPPIVPQPTEASAYYPLAPGWRWAYDVEKGADKILATYVVLERLADTVIVQAGEEHLAYALLPEGIARREGMNIGDFLLKTPIRAGASWPIAGGQAKVVSVGETVTVPGGTFANCAVIEENRSDPPRVLRTSYAAGVGPVALEQQVHDRTTGRYEVALRAKLIGVTRPGEDPLGAPEPNLAPTR